MYVVTKHDRKIAEWMEPQALRGYIDDLEMIVAQNKVYKQVMEEKDRGRPGHYYGRDVVIEGSIPMAAFVAGAAEYGGDPNWWRDDRKFQDYMKRNPAYDWFHR